MNIIYIYTINDHHIIQTTLQLLKNTYIINIFPTKYSYTWLWFGWLDGCAMFCNHFHWSQCWSEHQALSLVHANVRNSQRFQKGFFFFWSFKKTSQPSMDTSQVTPGFFVPCPWIGGGASWMWGLDLCVHLVGPGCPDMWSNIILDISLRVSWDEINS